jgi:hypothetical protein
MILSAVDSALKLDRQCALRFYDDYEIGVSSEGEAEELLHRAEAMFAEYELELNPEKSHVIRSSENLEAPWRLQIKLATKERPKRPEDAVDLFSMACSLARENETDFVLGYFLRRMRMFVLPRALWKVWQQILMATAFAEFGALRNIYEQLDLYERIGYPIDKTRLSDVLRKKAARELQGSISSELSWVLFGFLKFGLPVEPEMLEKVLLHGDDVSRILALKLASMKGLAMKRKAREMLNVLGPVDPNSEHWLLFWEVYRNGWAAGTGLKSLLTQEPMFSFLDKEGVSFLRDPGVDLLEVPAAFQRAIEKVHGSAEATRLEREIKKTFADISKEEPPDADEGLDDEDQEDEEPY